MMRSRGHSTRRGKKLVAAQGLTPVDEPSVTLVGGQPGAGKSTLCLTLEAEQPNSVVVDMDVLKTYQRGYFDVLRTDARNAHVYSARFALRLKNKIIRRATKRRYNIISEGTFSDPEQHIALLGEKRRRGYRTRVCIQICAADLSWNSCEERAALTGRLVERAFHDRVVSSLPDIALRIWQSGEADSMTIFERTADNDQGMSNSISPRSNVH